MEMGVLKQEAFRAIGVTLLEAIIVDALLKTFSRLGVRNDLRDTDPQDRSNVKAFGNAEHFLYGALTREREIRWAHPQALGNGSKPDRGNAIPARLYGQPFLLIADKGYWHGIGERISLRPCQGLGLFLGHVRGQKPLHVVVILVLCQLLDQILIRDHNKFPGLHIKSRRGLKASLKYLSQFVLSNLFLFELVHVSPCANCLINIHDDPPFHIDLVYPFSILVH
jgi:hypothetical protein